MSRSLQAARLVVSSALLSVVACGNNPPGVASDASADSSEVALDSGPTTTPSASDASTEAEAETSPACDLEAGPPIAKPRSCLLTPPTWWATDDGGLDSSDAEGGATESGDASDASDASDPSDGAGASDAPFEIGPSTTYPAFRVESPRVASEGGAVLSKPVFVTISWDGERDITEIERFVDGLGASDYWNQTTCEYGVGAGVSGCGYHVHLHDTLPTLMTDLQLQSYVLKHVTEWRAQMWPSDPAETVYVVVLPLATSVQFVSGGDSCSNFGGYHADTKTRDGSPLAYAIIPRCDFGTGTLDTSTSTISHELIEATTDPFPRNDPAFRLMRDADFAWTIFQVGLVETGDLCSYYRDTHYFNDEVGAAVQRTWSNASFAKAHAPCVPATLDANIGTMPIDLALVPYSAPAKFGGSDLMVRGLRVPPGSDGTFDVAVFSDAPTGDIALSVVEGNGLPGTGDGRKGAFSTGKVSVSISPSTARNGGRATVKVHVAGTDPTLDANLVTVVAHAGSVTRYWPVLITAH